MPGIATIFSKLRPYTWYVDSVNGNDANDGKTPATAFRTIGKLMTVLGSNQRVRLRRGSTWREEIYLTTQQNVTIRAYGSGTAPTFDCSDPVQSGWWSKTAGYTYVYQFSPTLNRYDAGHPIWNRVWENNVHLVRAGNLTNCDATPGSYYVSSDTTQTPTIYVHASDNGNPASNGKTYEYANRYSGVFAYDVNNLTLDGVICKRNLSADGSIVGGRYSRVLNCQANEGQKHNVYVRAGSYVANVQAIDAYYPAGYSMFVYNDGTPNNEGVTFVDCVAQQLDTRIWTNATGFYGHKNVSGSFGAVNYIRCRAEGMFCGFNGNDANLTYNDCVTTNCQNDYNVETTGVTRTINNHTSSSTKANPRAVNIVGDGAVVSINGYNADHSTASGTEYGIFVGSYNNPAITVRGMVYKGMSTGYVVRHTKTSGGGTIDIANCDFGSVYQYYNTVSGAAVITSDYNRFRQGNAGFTIQGTTYANVAAYQAGTGQDAHSTVG